AIVAALEDAPEAILHPRPSSVNRSPFRCRREGGKTCPADAEEESGRLGGNDPVGEQIPEEAATSVEELVEQILDGPPTQDCFTLHHLPRRHAPAPVHVAGVRLEDRSDGKSDFGKEVGQRHCWLSAL